MVINSPLSVTLPRKTMPDRKIILNLNNYPNWHYRTYAIAKIIYCEALQGVLSGLKLKTPIELHYTLFKASNRKSDRMNVGAVIDKFFCDALTHYECIPDDTDEFITRQTFETGGVDKNNPRITINIIENETN